MAQVGLQGVSAGLGVEGAKDVDSVVIDIGRVYAKYGIAGEHTPRKIRPSNLWQVGTGRTPPTREDYEAVLKPLLKLILFRDLKIRPAEFSCVVCEHVFMPIACKNALCSLLFDSFKMPFVSFVLAPALASLATTPVSGSPCALVISCAYHESYAVPVVNGLPVMKALAVSDLGLAAVYRHLHAAVLKPQKSEGAPPVLDPAGEFEDVVARLCYVRPLVGDEAATIMPPNALIQSEGTVPDAFVALQKREVTLRGEMRGCAGDVLFGGDEEDRCLATMVLDCLLKCEPDVVASVIGRVVLCGGGTMLDGFAYRLEQELRYLVTHVPTYQRLKPAIGRLDFAKKVFPANTVEWVGGSIWGKVEASHWGAISLEDFKANRNQPQLHDWTCIRERPVECKPEVHRKKTLRRMGTDKLLASVK